MHSIIRTTPSARVAVEHAIQTRTDYDIEYRLIYGTGGAVDDDTDALSLLSELLNAAGARVSAAHSAEEALRQLDTEPPSVLVSDLGMPHVDGFALIEQVRRHRNPIVRRLPD